MDLDTCRCCLASSKKELKNLLTFDLDHNAESKISFLEKLNICIPELQIRNPDPLPQQICPNCINRLHDAYNFRILCIMSDRQLKLAVGTVKIEPKLEMNESDPRVADNIETIEVMIPAIRLDEHYESQPKRCVKERKKAVAKIDMSKRQKKIGTDKLSGNDLKPKKARKNAARYNENGKRIRIRPLKFQCDVCGLRGNTKFRIEQHMRAHTGERPFVCETCGKAFKSRACVKKHSIRHQRDRIKRYQCDICKFSTDFNADFLRHLRVHTGDLPHPCTICGRRYSCKGALANHIRAFHTEPTMACTFCEEKFRTVARLRIHVECHFRPTKQTCPVCKILLTNRKALQRHMERFHEDVEYPSRRKPKTNDTKPDNNELKFF